MKIEGNNEILYIKNKNATLIINNLNQLILKDINFNEEDAKHTGKGTLYIDEHGNIKVVI